jgi:hypothetical protein
LLLAAACLLWRMLTALGVDAVLRRARTTATTTTTAAARASIGAERRTCLARYRASGDGGYLADE